MSRVNTRQIFFVCIALIDNSIISDVIAAESQDDASKIFTEKNSHPPKEIHGPFFKKKIKIVEPTQILKFSNQTKKAIYNDWIVNAFILKEPVNHAYLVFIKRTDDKKQPSPKGTITVPISELKFI